MNQVLAGVLRLFQAQLTAVGRPTIVSQIHLQPNLPMIAADSDQLHRAFSNLVLNAMDAMPEGGTLLIRTRALNSCVDVEISDTGIGLAEEERDRLFTPYYTSKAHGTGLGLAIVQSVVSDHHGRITVESAVGKGSTFRIELPFNLDKLNVNKVHEESAHTGA